MLSDKACEDLGLPAPSVFVGVVLFALGFMAVMVGLVGMAV
jgi:hypothetical protein